MANRFTLVTLVFLIKSHNFEFQVYVAVELSNNSCTCKNYMHEDSSYSVGLLRDKQSCCICVHWHQRPEGYTCLRALLCLCLGVFMPYTSCYCYKNRVFCSPQPHGRSPFPHSLPVCLALCLSPSPLSCTIDRQ